MKKQCKRNESRINSSNFAAQQSRSIPEEQEKKAQRFFADEESVALSFSATANQSFGYNKAEEEIYKLTFFQKCYRVIKAGLDFLIALLALVVLSPLFLITAIAIKIDSKGPVFFVQKRIGRGGKEFNCIKFRSMSVEAKHDVAGYEYAEADSYITKVGHVIRKLSIDELPQLFCLLTFKMSLIGYRPSQSNEHELNEAREKYDLYQIRPGLSGWAQVNGRDVLAAHPKKKAEYDAYYLRHFSLWLDIKIFFMTIAKVFKSEDIEEGVIEPTGDKFAENTSTLTVAEEVAAADGRLVEEIAKKEAEILQEVAAAEDIATKTVAAESVAEETVLEESAVAESVAVPVASLVEKAESPASIKSVNG
ncbi:MAG: sugar transferase [Candidatus Borkfalkiaceae bacterium]|nr:sugar transferase [Clostridia bacterium]MDY6222693.1 sugar transferase [Christensenellaceae bacterium]